jgi:nitroreductase
MENRPAIIDHRCFTVEEGKTFLRPGNLVRNPRLDMPLIEAIRERRTVRAYRDDPIADETILYLITAAIHAPSACNEQRWRFIVINDKSILEDLYWRGSAAFLKDARQAILVCYSQEGSISHQYQDSEHSAAAAITNLQLAAHAVGIGCCWICHLPPRREVRKMFGIPRYYDPIALVTIGYYRDNVKIKPRKIEAKDLISYNKWDFRLTPRPLVDWRHLFRYVLRRIYYLIPKRKFLRKYSLMHEKKFYNEIYD